jgi:integrase
MGVSVREKIKGSGEFWIFIRHEGDRAAQKVGDREAAQEIKGEILREIRTGRFDIAAMKNARAAERKEEKSSAPTLKDYFEKHLTKEYLESGVRQSTREAYEGAFNRHILPVLGDKPVDAITRADIKSFVGSLTRKKYERVVKQTIQDDHGKLVLTKVKMERSLSKASIRIVTASLCACLNHAREDGHIRENPANRLTKLYRQAKALHPEIQPLTSEEVPVFLQAAREHTPEYYELFLTLVHTGVRSGECAGIQWGDLDFNSKFAIVRRTVTPSGRIENTKTDRIRRVDLSDELIAALRDLRRRRKAEYLGRGKNEIPEWVFLSPGRIIYDEGKPVGREEGKRVDMHNVKSRAFRLVLDKAGLRRIRVHDLRHSYASILISAGVSPAYVQQQLGHASIKMTVDTYTHLIPGAGRQALAALPSIASPTSSQQGAATIAGD